MASLLLLIDGYNVVSPVAPPTRGDAGWLQRERTQLLARLTSHLSRDLRDRTCVVFDAANPPPDRPSQFQVEGIEVCFAVDHPEADDLLEEIIRAHHAPKQLAVVSSDRRVQAAARRRGATPFDSQVWLDQLLDGVVGLARHAKKVGRHQKRSKPKSSEPNQRRYAEQRDGFTNGDDQVQPSGDVRPQVEQPDHLSAQPKNVEPLVDPQDVQDWLKEFGYGEGDVDS